MSENVKSVFLLPTNQNCSAQMARDTETGQCNCA